MSGFFSHQVDHNFLGMFGVLRAPRDAGQIHRYERPVMPLIVMALLAIALLLVVHVLGLRA